VETTQQFETVIGLEVHLQLKTKTKIFCSCANDFGGEPNTRTCPVCLGLPGTLPVFNKQVLDYGIKIGLALNCAINNVIKFDRKNYYYPDLPKAYQISQFDLPIAKDGFLLVPSLNNELKKIRIHRAHLEEDAGKLMHDAVHPYSLVDYNRTGTPLMEIVSSPDMHSPQDAYDYLQTLKLTLQYLDVSDCDMEKGSLRCDANVSIRPKGETKLGTKTELKNMNSFKAVKAALEYEIARQTSVMLSGDKIIQETRLWDENKQMTFSMRSKEEAHDYRYFPEPDLVPFTISDEKIQSIKKMIPELPIDKYHRFIEHYHLSDYDARLLIQDAPLADFFEICAKNFHDTKKICNWLNTQVLQELNERKAPISKTLLTPDNLIMLIQKTDAGIISNLAAKDVLKIIFETGKQTEQIIEEQGLAQISDDVTLEKIADDLIRENQKVIEQIKNGEQKALGFLIGQAMKKMNGKANPKKIGDILQRRIFHG